MDTLQCAIVLAKLERFDWEVEQRIKIGAEYNKLLTGKVKTVTQRPDRTSVFAQYTVFVENRETVQTRLKDKDIPTAVHYPVPMHIQPAYSHLCCPECCPESVKAAERVMSLPMYPDMRLVDQNQVVNLIEI
jgi:UDP-2-acetamido-2-deoxy-ribo-hexuluronate aminotransferase